MKERNRKHSISGLSALLLLGVFAVGIFAVLFSGVNAYNRLTERDRLIYDNRTCVQYITTKVRQAPAPNAIALSDFGDGSSLIISEQIQNEEYWTQVYCYDGWLMELFTVSNGEFSPEDGEKIMPVQSLVFTLDDDLLRAELVDRNGTEASFLLNLRGRGGNTT